MTKLYNTDFECEYCGTLRTKMLRYGSKPRFCNRSCSNAWQHKQGIRRTYVNDKTTREWKIQKHGEDAVIKAETERREKATFISTYECEECHVTFMRNSPRSIRRFCTAKCRAEWLYRSGGKKRPSMLGKKHTVATRIKMQNSQIRRMIEHPETQGGFKSSIKGWYKGHFFRSSYEYFFMKKLESEGIDLRKDVEQETLRIQYEIGGTLRTYIPDFYVPCRNTVYEVKNSYTAKSEAAKAKMKAAIDELEKKCIHYEVLTEAQIPMPSSRKRKAVIQDDPCVFLLQDAKIHPNDPFLELFSEQERFMKLLQEKRNFPNFPVNLSTKEGQRLVKDITHDCMHELFEAIHLLRDAKSHRQTIVGGFDRNAFVEELADVWHYLIEIAILVGIDANELHRSYMKKGTINFARILGGY